jgi:excisionase family DNA binding protein
MKKKKRSPTDAITVIWENPPGPRQRIIIERVVRGHTYRRQVGPKGVLAPPEAAKALRVSREFVYRLIRQGKLKTVRRRGLMGVPLNSIKAYRARRREGRRPVMFFAD